ncbi:hypothetical protein CJU90_3105 [Yarrowia sp. C11]|nr:hypothetical protein CKK34_4554 [Yarrowia sp. E02]KAG5369632.1 hypothetical protein CJU90_3105 [Yarrowia sp. C11]
MNGIVGIPCVRRKRLSASYPRSLQPLLQLEARSPSPVYVLQLANDRTPRVRLHSKTPWLNVYFETQP